MNVMIEILQREEDMTSAGGRSGMNTSKRIRCVSGA